jgi:hypothetical protein
MNEGMVSGSIPASSARQSYQTQWELQWQWQPSNTSDGTNQTSIHPPFPSARAGVIAGAGGSSNGDNDYDYDDETTSGSWQLVLQSVLQNTTTAF